MTSPSSRVSDDEEVARYVLFSRWVRSSDQSVRPDAFTPNPNDRELSVTRHVDISERELWDHGLSVARQSMRTLHGRADLGTSVARAQGIEVSADPIPENPNHACLVGWPPESEKALLKAITQELADNAQYVAFQA